MKIKMNMVLFILLWLIKKQPLKKSGCKTPTKLINLKRLHHKNVIFLSVFTPKDVSVSLLWSHHRFKNGIAENERLKQSAKYFAVHKNLILPVNIMVLMSFSI